MTQDEARDWLWEDIMKMSPMNLHNWLTSPKGVETVAVAAGGTVRTEMGWGADEDVWPTGGPDRVRTVIEMPWKAVES